VMISEGQRAIEDSYLLTAAFSGEVNDRSPGIGI